MTRRVAIAIGVSLALAAPPAATAITPPDSDAFYRSPAGLADADPGAVLRSRKVTVTAAGVPLPFSAWQVLYRTDDSHGQPVSTVATIMVPPTPYRGPGPRPLVSYQTAIDGLGPECNPSYTLRAGTEKEEASIVPTALLEGWAVVVPDFEGPRYAYTAGPMAAHATLDGVRAAEGFRPAGLRGRTTPVGFWGYSGGGQATAWTAERQPHYAPELNAKGFAEGGVPADVEQTARHLDGGLFFGIEAAAAVGLSREFPEMRIGELLNAEGRKLVSGLDGQCINEFIAAYPFHKMADYTKPRYGDPLDVSRIARVLRKDSLGKSVPTAPVYLYHSPLDQLIPVTGPDKLFRTYCAAGAKVLYRRAPLGEHIGYAAVGAPQAFLWLADRFAGRPAPSNCA